METKEAAIEMFKELASRGKTAKISENRLKSALALLQDEVDRGFSIEEINTLVSALVTIPLTLPKFTSLIRVIIPETKVSDSAMENMALWASMNHKQKQTCAILALQWITAVIENELAMKSSLDSFFELFYAMMRYPGMQKDAVKLVYMLINPEDVSRWRVNTVLGMHQVNKGLRHTNALLQRFKAYRPELIPEAVANFSVASAFKKTSALFAQKMADAAERGAGQRQTEGIVWGEGDSVKRRGFGWREQEFVPAPLVLNLGSKHRRHKTEASAIQRFKTLESLACHQLTLALPCQALSLLENSAGRHLLMFGNVGLKERLANTLSPKLTALLCRGSVDTSHTASVLGKLAALQQSAQQGLPAVSNAMVNFLHTWNGEDFHGEIWELLERCSYHSELVLPTLVFPHILRVFLQADEDGRSFIIRSMTRLVQYQFESCWRASKELSTMFQGAPSPTAELLSSTTQFVGKLCAYGLTNGSQRHVLLLDASLSFYHMVSLLEADSKMPVWTVMPAAVFYRALFSRSLHSIQGALRILIRYQTVNRQAVASLGVAADFSSEAKTVSRFAADTTNCLWDSKAFSGRGAGLVFRHFSESTLLAMAKRDDLDQAFAPMNNLAFAPFIDRNKDWKPQVNEILPELRQLVQSSSVGKAKPARRK